MRSNPQEYTEFYLFAYAFNVKAYHNIYWIAFKKKKHPYILVRFSLCKTCACNYFFSVVPQSVIRLILVEADMPTKDVA